MLKKPENPGIPAIASVATRNVAYVTGRCFLRPPIFLRSCSPLIAWITLPEPRNSSALKNACVIRWNIAAENAPTPAARNMYPSWLTVEYASTFLMSV